MVERLSGTQAEPAVADATPLPEFSDVLASVRARWEFEDDMDDICLEIAQGEMDGHRLKEAKRLLVAMTEMCVHHAVQLPLKRRDHGALWFEVQAFLNPSTTAADASTQAEPGE